jgi:hypothetical protein
MPAKSKTTSDFKDEVTKLVGDEYSVKGEYIKSSSKIEMIHNTCETPYLVTPNHFLRGMRCPSCSSNKAKTTEWFKSEVAKTTDAYVVKGVYTNNKTKISLMHLKCGTEYETMPTHFLQGSRCPHCFGTTLKSNEKFKEEIKNSLGDKYSLQSEYVNDKTHVTLKHLECEKEYSVTPTNILQGKLCPYCFGNIKLTSIEFREKIFNLVGDDYTVLSEYENIDTHVLIRHNECNHEYNVVPNNFLNQGNRCSKCVFKNKRSNAEDELLLFIRKIAPNLLIETSNRSILRGKELDIFIPSINLAIEYNGVYWHSESQGKYKAYHLEKKQMCFENGGLNLIHLLSSDWVMRKAIVKDRLRHKLGVKAKNVVYARKCEVVEIDSGITKDFLVNTHIQGHCQSSVNLGLVFQEELVAVMTFGVRKITGGDAVLELLRFSTALDTHIPGAASKLFKYFLINYDTTEFKSLVSYADLNYSNIDPLKTVYAQLGFSHKHISPPSYSYFKRSNESVLHHRSVFMKHKLKDKLESFNEDLSEYENMLNNRYERIWNCGNHVFEYILS